MHYTNPSLKSGIVDNSGIFYRLADTLRPHDASTMLAGPVDYHNLIAIPPQQVGGRVGGCGALHTLHGSSGLVAGWMGLGFYTHGRLVIHHRRDKVLVMKPTTLPSHSLFVCCKVKK